MSCVFKYKNKEYSEKEFKQLLSNGELQLLASNGKITIGSEFYQIDKSQEGVESDLLKMHDQVQPNDDKTYLVNGQPLRRVTSLIKERQRKKFGSAVDQATKDLWEEARATGDKVHLFNQDIINRLFNRASVVDLTKLSPNDKLVYDNLEAYINDLVKLKIQRGSVFHAEVKIADVEKNKAGTVDLIEILPDGNINIYDYKTRSKENLSKIKLDEYSQQLKEYSDILEKQLGVKVIQRRIVPIKITKKVNGELKIDIKSQLAVAQEKTNIPELDQLLDALYSKLDYLTSQKVSDSKKPAHQEKIESTQKAIEAIQINRDLTIVLETGLDTVNQIIEDLTDNTFDINTDLKDAHDSIKLYKELDKYVPDSFLSDDIKTKLAVVTTQARLAERKLIKTEEKYLVENGVKYGVIGTGATPEDFLSPVKELGSWNRWMQGASYSEHPILNTLRRAAEEKVVSTREQFVKIRDEIKDKQTKMFDYLGETSFDVLLQKSEDGSKTGKLVSRIKNEYWKQAAIAKSAGNVEWFKNNSVFDLDRYNKDYVNYKKFISSRKTLKEDVKESIINKWVKENESNWFKYHKADDSWVDPAWNDIVNGKYKGTPVEDFYNFYTSTMNSLLEELPIEDVYQDFIPNMKAGFLDRVANVGIGNVLKSGFDFSFLEVLHEDPKYGKFDAENNPIDNIPILYSDKLKASEKSYDLGLLLAAFSSTALNYKNLTELEGLKEASLAFVRNQDELLTTSTGKVKQSQSGQDRKKKNFSSNSHYGQLKDYVDAVFYGRRRLNEKTATFKNRFVDRVTNWAKGEESDVEREYSWSKVFDSVLNFTAIKALGFNLFAPITNYLSGEASSFITGVNGLYFDSKDKLRALQMLASNDPKAKMLIDKFNVKMGDFELDELKMLSTDKLKVGPQDIAFAGYHIGDYAVQNSNFIAMLLSGKHDIKWEDFEIVDGKLVDKKGFTNLDISKFRNKALKVNKKIMGNMDKNDQAAAKRYMLGRAIFQFRNWLPAMFEERWGKKRFDYDLEVYTEGRYRIGYAYFIDHVINPLLGKTKKELLAWKSLTPEQRAAMKSNLLDLVMILGVFAMVGIVKGDDDDEKTMLSKYSFKVIDRLLAELTFFTLLPLPNVIQDKYQIIISPAASVSTIEDLIRIWDHTAKKVMGDEKADPARAFKRLVPGVNQILKLEELMEKN